MKNNLKHKIILNEKQEIIRKHLTCTCDEMYKDRNMVDPTCFLCEYESEIELMMDEYLKITFLM